MDFDKGEKPEPYSWSKEYTLLDLRDMLAADDWLEISDEERQQRWRHIWPEDCGLVLIEGADGDK